MVTRLEEESLLFGTALLLNVSGSSTSMVTTFVGLPILLTAPVIWNPSKLPSSSTLTSARAIGIDIDTNLRPGSAFPLELQGNHPLGSTRYLTRLGSNIPPLRRNSPASVSRKNESGQHYRSMQPLSRIFLLPNWEFPCNTLLLVPGAVLEGNCTSGYSSVWTMVHCKPSHFWVIAARMWLSSVPRSNESDSAAREIRQNIVKAPLKQIVRHAYPPIWYISTLAGRGMSGVAAKRSSE